MKCDFCVYLHCGWWVSRVCKLAKLVVKFWNQTHIRWKHVAIEESSIVGNHHQSQRDGWELPTLEGSLNSVHPPYYDFNFHWWKLPTLEIMTIKPTNLQRSKGQFSDYYEKK